MRLKENVQFGIIKYMFRYDKVEIRGKKRSVILFVIKIKKRDNVNNMQYISMSNWFKFLKECPQIETNNV